MRTDAVLLFHLLLLICRFQKLLLFSEAFSSSSVSIQISHSQYSPKTVCKRKVTIKLSERPTHNNNNNRREEDRAIIIVPKKPAIPKSSSESTFWYSIPEKEETNSIPCDPNFDIDGPLPPNAGCYRQSSSSPKCLITIDIDTRKDNNHRRVDEQDYNTFIDKMDVVRGMQTYMDKGFTTFQVAPGGGDAVMMDEGTIFGTLWKETPRSVITNSCHLSSILKPIPLSTGFLKKAQIRDYILVNSFCTGAEYLDTVLVPYQQNSPHVLDILDVLMDLQRDGLVKGIGGLNFPSSLIRDANKCGFRLDSNQASCNIIDQRLFQSYKRRKHDGLLLEASSPLAGALLTERFYRHHGTTKHKKQPPDCLTQSQSSHLNTIKLWANNNKHFWNVFDETLLKTIHDISLKHEVPMAAVALRWVLQQHFGTAVVTTGVGRIDRCRHFCEVFKFALDENDLMLIEQSYQKGTLPFKEDSIIIEGEEEVQNEQESLMVDLSDRRLWIG